MTDFDAVRIAKRASLAENSPNKLAVSAGN